MNLAYITEQLARIEAIRGDDEAAHAAQDDLYEEVLEAIADGHPDAQELAAHVLAVREIKFERWCA